MKNMQVFYRWLTADTRQEDRYHKQLVGLTRADLTKIISASGFWGWNIWGSPSGPDTK